MADPVLYTPPSQQSCQGPVPKGGEPVNLIGIVEQRNEKAAEVAKAKAAEAPFEAAPHRTVSHRSHGRSTK